MLGGIGAQSTGVLVAVLIGLSQGEPDALVPVEEAGIASYFTFFLSWS
jgi:hypothetical protein